MRCYSDWLSKPKVTGNTVLRVEVYFTVYTETPIRELVMSQLNYLQEEEIRVIRKRTGDEHTSRLGFIIGPVIDKVNIGWYKKMIKQLGKIADEDIELKKQIVYEGSKNEWYLTLHRMGSVKDKIDMAIRQIKFSTHSHIKYVLFANSTRNERIGALQLNKFINIKLKYECLEDVGVLDAAKFQDQTKILSEFFMNAKKNGISLFNGIEQGSGKNEKNTYVYFKGTMATEAREWIRKNYGTTITVEDKNEYKTSLPVITTEEETYHKELNDYIVDRMKEITIYPNKKINTHHMQQW